MRSFIPVLFCLIPTMVLCQQLGEPLLWEKTIEKEDIHAEYTGMLTVVKKISDSVWLCGGHFEFYGKGLLGIIEEAPDGRVRSKPFQTMASSNPPGPTRDIVKAADGNIYTVGEVGFNDYGGPTSYVAKFDKTGELLWVKVFYPDSSNYSGEVTNLIFANDQILLLKTSECVLFMDTAGGFLNRLGVTGADRIADICAESGGYNFLSYNNPNKSHGIIRFNLSKTTDTLYLPDTVSYLRRLSDSTYAVAAGKKLYMFTSKLILYDSLDLSNQYAEVGKLTSKDSLLFILVKNKDQNAQTVLCASLSGNFKWAFAFPSHIQLTNLCISGSQLVVCGSETFYSGLSHAFAKSFSATGETLPFENNVSVARVVQDSVQWGKAFYSGQVLLATDIYIYSSATIYNNGTTLVDSLWLGGSTGDGIFGKALSVIKHSGLKLQPGDSVSLPVVSYRQTQSMMPDAINSISYKVYVMSPNGSLDLITDSNHTNATASFLFVQVKAIARSGQVMSIYPIPASEILNIDFSRQVSGCLKFSDLMGRLIKQHYLHQAETFKIDISNLSAGTYIAHFLSENGEAGTMKIIIAR